MRRKQMLGQRARRRRTIIISIMVFVVVGLVVFAGFAVHWDRLYITQVVVAESDYIASSDVEALVWESLAGSYWYIAPRRNSVIYPRETIRERILSTYPRIGDVTIRRNGFSQLQVTFQTHDPHALWCQSEARECFYVTDTGYVFDRAPYFSDNVYFIYEDGMVNWDDPVGSRVFEVERFREVEMFVDSLRGLGLNPVRLQGVPDGTPTVVLSEGGEVLFDDGNDFMRQTSNLLHVVEDTEGGLYPITETRFDLEYIDLRFDGKVYYKMYQGTSTPRT